MSEPRTGVVTGSRSRPLVPAPAGPHPEARPVPGATPRWLLQGELAMCPCGCVGKRKRGSFVEKTLTGGAGLLRQVMFSEDVAGQPGLLQRVDARVKLVGLLLLLVATGLVHHVTVLVAVYAANLLLAAASGLPVGFFV